MDPAEWHSGLARKRIGSGALIRDDDGRVLLVKPTYKPGWELPGGAVEVDESPWNACRRELSEKLGLDLAPGRLLCLEWQGSEPDRTESLMFLYDGGVLGEREITLPPEELAAYLFVAPDRVDEHLSPRLARRLRAALVGLAEGGMVEMEDGRVLP